MKYRIEEVREFTVCGMGVEITNWQNQNNKICRKLWIEFNKILKRNQLHQQGHWRKYAFTYKENDKLYYFCSIPEQYKIPKEFEVKSISRQCYLIYEHEGEMATIKDTIYEIYKEFLPKHNLIIDKVLFFHFERYDKRFYWDSPLSIIDIYVPVTKQSALEEVGELEYGNDI